MTQKLEIYEDGSKVGEVTADPYDWSYSGSYQAIEDALSSESITYQIQPAEPVTDDSRWGERPMPTSGPFEEESGVELLNVVMHRIPLLGTTELRWAEE